MAALRSVLVLIYVNTYFLVIKIVVRSFVVSVKFQIPFPSSPFEFPSDFLFSFFFSTTRTR